MKLKIYLLAVAISSLCLLSLSAQAQLPGAYVYDFRDGTIITNGESADGNLTLSGTYSHHGGTYGLNMKVDGELNIAVNGSVTIRFLGSAYSGLTMKGTAETDGDLGTLETKVQNDLTDVYDFVYSGQATTLNFKLLAGTNNDLYLPQVEIIPSQSGADATATASNISYYYDFRDGSIVPTDTDGLSDIDMGLINVIVGSSNAYGYNGSQHGAVFKGGNQIILDVSGNTLLKVGGSIYSNGTISVSSATGDFDVSSQSSTTSGNFGNDGSTVDFLYVGTSGTITLDFSGTNYVPYIETAPIPYPVSLNTYQQKSGNVTINGLEISLSSGATASDNASISVSEGIVLNESVDNGSIALNLGGQDPETLSPTFTGDISDVSITGNELNITFTEPNADPTSFTITLFDNSFFHNITSYDFRDGSIITNGESNDGLLTLGGNYSHHGTTYGLNIKLGASINLTVPGSSSIQFLGSQYSGLNLQATAFETGDLGTLSTTVAADLVDTYDYTYSGSEQAINFLAVEGTNNDIYLPKIDVIPSQLGIAYPTASQNIIYYFDFRDGSIIPTNTNGLTGIQKGLVEIVVGSSNAYGYNGTQHGSILKGGNQIKLQLAGNSLIKVGGSIYSSGTISVSSETGDFDISSQSSTTSGNYGTDGSSVDFLYVGEAGVATLDFTGTNYVPFIEVQAVTKEVTLTSYVQKSGTITINGTEIGLSSGVDASTNAEVTVSAGTVYSATNEEASIAIDLGGNNLSTFSPVLTGDIASVNIVENTLEITYSDESTNPTSYLIQVTDNSQIVEAEPGVTYTYSFADGSELPQVSYSSLRYSSFLTEDGIVTMNSNTSDESMQFGYHDATHGGVFFPGNSFDIIVAGNATITFLVDTYGVAADAVFEFTDSEDNVLGTISAVNLGGDDGFPSNFSYEGPAGTITATLLSTDFSTAEIYLHGLSIANEATIDPSNGKIDVWDFGAAQLNTDDYNNKLDAEIINAWYDDSITEGSSGNVMPGSFSAGVLNWVGGGNDRLRTTNTSLTRYDENISDAGDYTGRLYVNSAGAVGRYLSLTLSEDDKVTIATKTDAGGKINFQYVANPELQTDVINITSDLTELTFVAKNAGTYHIFDTQGKPSYYRIYREDAEYADISGSVDVSLAQNIPAAYELAFTNEAGKVWTTSVSNGQYSISLPIGYNYELSLLNANGYIVSSSTTLTTTESAAFDIVIEEVTLFTVSGSILGLGTAIANLELSYSTNPEDNKAYIPVAVVDAENNTYSVDLEPNTEYTIHAQGVNDYYIPSNTITIGSTDETADIQFEAKTLYNVAITAENLGTEELASLGLTFKRLEDEYSYHFNSVESVALRDGTYTIAYDGLDEYPVELALTSNLQVNGSDLSKTLEFKPVTNWAFDDQEITNSTPAYKGMLFSGLIANEQNKGHLTANAEATIQVPVQANQKVAVGYYYTADFSIESEGPYVTESNSTSTFEYANYIYTGTEPSYVTLTIGSSVSTTYITNISVLPVVDYQATITVGADKDYQTINEALEAISYMDRSAGERVTVLIDPGNYEEMLVINEADVTLKNAASRPSIALLNKGVDIEEAAVRITSYYGHGYNYYSMGSDQKWDARVLEVNNANGYLSYENKGAGTTNGSFWNATVVVNAHNFVAEDIIFENSFNQYISKKEAEDIVVMWESGSRGERPTNEGSTNVQDRSFVERAAALAITNGVDKVILDKCRIVGRQDALYGGQNSRVVVYKGAMMGAVDYIFGGMTAVFYQTDLVMNVSDNSSDRSYITAAQQNEGRGYLMYECKITSAVPAVETASTFLAKPGYFGRPWQATTSEVVFYNTTIETSDYTGSEQKSLIEPLGWQNTLGGESELMYEYGTTEESGEDNSGSRASWATLLSEPSLLDGTEITTFNFTKGNDDWDPLPGLIDTDLDTDNFLAELSVAEGDLSPAFDPEITEYEVEVPFGTSSINVTATARSTAATVTIGNFNSLPGKDIIVVTSEDGIQKEYSITVTVAEEVVTSNKSGLGKHQLRVYPNPVSDHKAMLEFVTDKPEAVIIKVYNLKGESVKVIGYEATNVGQQQISLDLHGINSGLYMINVYSGKYMTSSKILIQ